MHNAQWNAEAHVSSNANILLTCVTAFHCIVARVCMYICMHMRAHMHRLILRICFKLPRARMRSKGLNVCQVTVPWLILSVEEKEAFCAD